MKNISLSEKQKEIVLEILNKHFPMGKYYIFGSRATLINLKPFSDLDIAVEDLQKITFESLAKASEEFSGSDLPFKVDLIDLKSVSSEFFKAIEKDRIQIK